MRISLGDLRAAIRRYLVETDMAIPASMLSRLSDEEFEMLRDQMLDSSEDKTHVREPIGSGTEDTVLMPGRSQRHPSTHDPHRSLSVSASVLRDLSDDEHEAFADQFASHGRTPRDRRPTVSER